MPVRALPDRYSTHWGGFDYRVNEAVAAASEILDVGAGALPVVPRDERPPGARYVGLDLSQVELDKAATGYDETLAQSVTIFVPELANRFDLALSRHLLEHVEPLDAAIENIRRYLRCGGRFLTVFAGKFSGHAIANQLLPARVARRLAEASGREPGTVFPAPYHGCWYGNLETMFDGWSSAEIVPLYLGAQYFNRVPPLRTLYLAYEEWSQGGQHRNLASHYLVDARR